ncbi:prostaglandin D2 receptor 2-like [Aplochiton taeniatus]
MASPSGPVYCPLIQQMRNASSQLPNNSARAGSLGLLCLHGLFSSLGILENLLILAVVGLRIRRTVISVWILNLAISDLLATASLPFFTLFLARGMTWTLGTTFCRLHSSVFFLNMFVSGLLLAAISLDRCLVVLRPVWAQNHRDVRLVGKVCGLIWLLAVLCTIPFYLFRDTIGQSSGRVMCYYNYALYRPAGHINLAKLCEGRQEALAFMKLFIAFLLPLVAIVASYIGVSVSVARRGHRRSFRFVRLVVAVVVSFVVCWAPYHLFSVLEVVAPQASPLRAVAARVLPLAASLSFLNSVLNPVLYVFSCPDLCSKIRQSLGTVMESVLAEDLGEWMQRHSTTRSSTSTSEYLLRGRGSLPTASQRGEREDGGEEREVDNKEEEHKTPY